MKALVLAATFLAAALPSMAAMPAALDSDPLMKQILAKQLTHPNGGITAAVAVRGAAKGIDLVLPDPLALPAPVEGLVAPAKKQKKARPARRADEQAENLEAAGTQASFERAGK